MNYNLVLLCLLFSRLAHGINLADVPSSVRQSYADFLSPKFDGSNAPKEWSHIKNGETIYHLKYPDDMDSPAEIGYCHKKNLTVFHAGRTKKEVLFRAQYQFDEFRRRSVGLERRDSQGKHIVLAGCSFAMGTSLSDKDTVAYHLARISKEHYPINLGVAGSGTNTMLAMTEHNLLPASVFSEEGAFVYFFLDFHIPRANGFAMEREWLWDTPYYESNKQGRLSYAGNFKEAQPLLTKFYHFTQTLLKKFGVALNYPKLFDSHIDYTCRLIEEAKINYLSKFPKGRFVVYGHPYSSPNEKLVRCITNKSIEYYRSNLIWDKLQHAIPYDDHPNGKINLEIAKELKTHLSL